jgi:hypothetical protein
LHPASVAARATAAAIHRAAESRRIDMIGASFAVRIRRTKTNTDVGPGRFNHSLSLVLRRCNFRK